MTDEARKQIAESIDAIEGAYEFFLAYAAQGITKESQSSRVGAQLRTHLDRMATAVSGLAQILSSFLEEEEAGSADRVEAFGRLVEADAGRTSAVLSLVQAQESITSQLVDNLNASVHVRTLLTDLFLLDEVLKLGVDQETAPEASGSVP